MHCGGHFFDFSYSLPNSWGIIVETWKDFGNFRFRFDRHFMFLSVVFLVFIWLHSNKIGLADQKYLRILHHVFHSSEKKKC